MKSDIREKYDIDLPTVYHIIKLVETYGVEVLIKSNTKRSNEEKLSAVKKVIDEGNSMHEVAVEFALSDCPLLKQWVHKYKKNGYIIRY